MSIIPGFPVLSKIVVVFQITSIVWDAKELAERPGADDARLVNTAPTVPYSGLGGLPKW